MHGVVEGWDGKLTRGVKGPPYHVTVPSVHACSISLNTKYVWWQEGQRQPKVRTDNPIHLWHLEDETASSRE